VPIRTLLEQHKEEFNKVALFCTMGSSGDLRARRDVEKIIGKSAVGLLAITTKEAFKDEYRDKTKEFIGEVYNAK
jgi:hypothetical protein